MAKIRGCKKRSLHVILILGACLLAVCSRNPEERKQFYLGKADSYFQKGQYREAAIMYQNVIQIEPRFAQAHYQLALCYLRQSEWQRAYAEAMRTVELEPTNWKAHLTVGDLLLAARQYASAREHAEAVLKGEDDRVFFYNWPD